MGSPLPPDQDQDRGPTPPHPQPGPGQGHDTPWAVHLLRSCRRSVFLFILFERTVYKVPNFTFSPHFVPKHVSRGRKADETAAQGDSDCCDQQVETPTRC